RNARSRWLETTQESRANRTSPPRRSPEASREDPTASSISSHRTDSLRLEGQSKPQPAHRQKQAIAMDTSPAFFERATGQDRSSNRSLRKRCSTEWNDPEVAYRPVTKSTTKSRLSTELGFGNSDGGNSE